MSNQHLKQLTGNENTSKTVFNESMEITEPSWRLEMLWFCLCYAEFLGLLHWMLHCVCNSWAKPKLSVTDFLLKFFTFVKRLFALVIKERLLAIGNISALENSDWPSACWALTK